MTRLTKAQDRLKKQQPGHGFPLSGSIARKMHGTPLGLKAPRTCPSPKGPHAGAVGEGIRPATSKNHGNGCRPFPLVQYQVPHEVLAADWRAVCKVPKCPFFPRFTSRV